MNTLRPIWFYSYVLKSKKDNNFYTGVTTDLKGRIKEHYNGLVPSTKYRRPLQLIYYEACLDKDDVFRQEIWEEV